MSSSSSTQPSFPAMKMQKTTLPSHGLKGSLGSFVYRSTSRAPMVKFPVQFPGETFTSTSLLIDMLNHTENQKENQQMFKKNCSKWHKDVQKT